MEGIAKSQELWTTIPLRAPAQNTPASLGRSDLQMQTKVHQVVRSNDFEDSELKVPTLPGDKPHSQLFLLRTLIPGIYQKTGGLQSWTNH